MDPIKLDTQRSPFRDDVIYGITVIGLALLGIAYFSVPNSIPVLLGIGVVIYLGFGLPKWIGRKERNQRALYAKEKEQEIWGFHGRDRDGTWIVYVDYSVIKEAPNTKGKYFYSEWLVVHDGIIVVNPGRAKVDRSTLRVTYDCSKRCTYAWDGCSPKRLFFWVALIGTPDWWQEGEDMLTVDERGQMTKKRVFWPKAHYASLIHDALYQYLGNIPIYKEIVDDQFRDMLIASGFPSTLAKLYHWAVRKFGARDVPQNAVGANSSFTVSGLPFLTSTSRSP